MTLNGSASSGDPHSLIDEAGVCFVFFWGGGGKKKMNFFKFS